MASEIPYLIRSEALFYGTINLVEKSYTALQILILLKVKR